MKLLNPVFFSLLFFCANCFASDDAQWRSPAPENLVYLKLDTGMVVIELAPFIATEQVERFKNLVDEGFYNGLDFYRVIDGFVAQGGDMSETKKSQYKKPLKAEFTRKIPKDSAFSLIQSPEFMAPQTGYLQGFSAGRDLQTNEEWLLHCPGTVAFARGLEADWVTPDFYITIGQATRHLDRNMSSLGRVIYGMPAVQKIKRANMNIASGVIEEAEKRSKIVWAKRANDVPENERLHIQVLMQDSESAKKRIADARTMENAFFHFKGNGNIDLCYYPLKTRLIE